jgi:CysZ protein
MITRFVRGMSFFGRGLRLGFGHGALLPFVLAPAIVAAGLTTAIAWYAQRELGAHFARQPHGVAMDVFIWIAIKLLVFAIGYLTYNVCCVVATAPFASVLAERTERIATGKEVPRQSLGVTLSGMWRGAGHTILGALIYIAVAVPLFLVHWLILPLAPMVWILGFTQTALFFAFDAFNEPLHREANSFDDKWRFVLRHGAESLGFGSAVALCMMLPLVSLVVTPVSIVGGALLFIDLRHKTRAPHV